LATGFFRVQPDEQGVPLVFGKWDGLTVSEGLHWNWPRPVGQVFTPKVTRSNQANIGGRSGDVRTRASSRGRSNETSMLTSDQNIVDLQFTVFWKIKNAGDFLFNIRNPEATVTIAATSVMRDPVGQTPFNDVVTVGREAIEQRAHELLQNILDQYNAGILIEGVKLQNSAPPEEVIDAFLDVQRARQDKDRLQNEAEAYANTIVPEARGMAEQMTRGADAYKQRLLKEAEGEAARFISVYEAYKTAPQVTRRRMYLETMGEVLGSAQKVIIDQKGGSRGGVVPYLPLPEIQKRARGGSGEQPAAASPTPNPKQR
jgi:membrane protease subunit HflK